MTRRCSHCSKDGHNSRTCPTARVGSGSGSGSGGVKLFGVRLTEGVGSMKKSASMGNLSSSSSSHFSSSSSPNNNNNNHHHNQFGSDPTRDHSLSGYASDDPNHACSSSNSRSERKKGTPWTEEEHRMFLLGLQKLGKGDWRGIARNFVVSRTPTQVASHAQKYFIRQTNASRRKRRSSLFDIVPETQTDQQQIHDEQQLMIQSPTNEPENASKLPSLQLSQNQEPEPAEPPYSEPIAVEFPYNNIPLPPPALQAAAYYPAFVPVFYPSFWPPRPMALPSSEAVTESHEVLRPTPVLPKEPRNVDEIVRLSKLSIGEGGSNIEPSGLSLKLTDGLTSRQSAFHVNPTVVTGAELSPRNRNPIHAV